MNCWISGGGVRSSDIGKASRRSPSAVRIRFKESSIFQKVFDAETRANSDKVKHQSKIG